MKTTEREIIAQGIAHTLREASSAVGYHDEMPGHTTLLQKQGRLWACYKLALKYHDVAEIKRAVRFAKPELDKILDVVGITEELLETALVQYDKRMMATKGN